MKDVDLYLKVRHAVRIEGLSERAAARRFGIDPRTVNKMMKFSVPPGYVRKKPPAKPKLDPFIPVIDRILGVDKSRPKKQLHTAKRIFERLRDEYGFTRGASVDGAPTTLAGCGDAVVLYHMRCNVDAAPMGHMVSRVLSLIFAHRYSPAGLPVF